MTMSTVVPVKEDIGNPRFYETRDASHNRTLSARLCGNRRRRSLSYHLGESADARLAREHLIGTSLLLSLDPSLSLVK